MKSKLSVSATKIGDKITIENTICDQNKELPITSMMDAMIDEANQKREKMISDWVCEVCNTDNLDVIMSDPNVVIYRIDPNDMTVVYISIKGAYKSALIFKKHPIQFCECDNNGVKLDYSESVLVYTPCQDIADYKEFLSNCKIAANKYLQ